MTARLPESQEKAKRVLSNLNHFTLVEGCIYYVDPVTSTLQLVVPEKYRKLEFHERHGGVFGTHLSAASYLRNGIIEFSLSPSPTIDA